ncbi:MAG: Gfo/Idh/MocA family oxidoreductase [Armatimonadetes bacterium]|nr:Gfo/Idh/MocA family oxidoreductase [Armatimonadota bacterium]
MPAPNVCRLAIVGAGNMARAHVQAFMDVPGVVVAGICSRTRSRAETFAEEFGVPCVCDSVAELYERTRADLVLVAVSVLALHEVGLACLEHPWTVFMEKPPGRTMAQAFDLQQVARARDRRVLVALNRRFLSSSRAAAEDLDQIEGPRFIQVHDQQDRDAIIALGHPASTLDTLMFSNSIHCLDLLRYFARGEVVTVTPVTPWAAEGHGPVVAAVDFSSGDRGLYVGIWEGPGPWAVTINAPEKRWELRPLERAAYQRRGERQLHPVELSPWDEQFRPGLRLQAERAVAAALGQACDAPTLDQAVKTMALIEAIYFPRECGGDA